MRRVALSLFALAAACVAAVAAVLVASSNDDDDLAYTAWVLQLAVNPGVFVTATPNVTATPDFASPTPRTGDLPGGRRMRSRTGLHIHH
jgi:hypothetical protein